MPDKASTAIKNSVYYLIEMIQIMPVIFLLTVVIDVLVPKEIIIKHFGEKSGLLGNMLSLILGSISAGPIYAAFPVSKMLLTKGASIPNIVIILSSWAVIKVPMLANEAKFLGVSFMGVRWILTVITILIMAWITGKIVDKKELLLATQQKSDTLLYINQDYCVGCGLCVKLLPDVFEMIDKKAQIKCATIPDTTESDYYSEILQILEKCPIQAISFSLPQQQ